MYSFQKDNSFGPTILKFYLLEGETHMTVRQVIQAWRGAETFCLYFSKVLVTQGFDAFFWEAPPADLRSLDRPFEFVLINSTTLASFQPNFNSFQQHFETDDLVVHFKNLGGDAELVVPRPLDNQEGYGHLASFLRLGPEDQIIQFWKKVGEVYEKAINERTVWLSTAGLGIPWLHVRLDSRPKYYRHRPYK